MRITGRNASPAPSEAPRGNKVESNNGSCLQRLLFCFAAAGLILLVAVLFAHTRGSKLVFEWKSDTRRATGGSPAHMVTESSEDYAPPSIRRAFYGGRPTKTRRKTLVGDALPTAEGRHFRGGSEVNPLAPDPRFPYQLLEASECADSGSVRYRSRGAFGTEIVNRYGDSRRYVPSEDQRHYPEAESGCGPAAILNWILWYQDFHVLQPPEARMGRDEQRWRSYVRIEEEIFRLRGGNVSHLRGSTTHLEIISAFDRTVNLMSAGNLRLHFEIFPAPVNVEQLVRFTTGFRAAILIVEPINPRTGEAGGLHAVSAAAGDRAGYIMVSNWGGKLHGPLRIEGGEQYFYPNDEGEWPLRIHRLITFIPIQLDPPVDYAITDLPLHRPFSRARNPFLREERRSSVPVTQSWNSARTRPVEPVSEVERIGVVVFHSLPAVPHGYRVSLRNYSDRKIRLSRRSIQGVFSDGKILHPAAVGTDFQGVTRQDPNRLWQSGATIRPNGMDVVDIRFDLPYDRRLLLERVIVR